MQRFFAELSRETSVAARIPWAVVAGSVSQVLALAVFFHTMWSGIRAVGSAAREAKGERFRSTCNQAVGKP
jgi:hypothetical protein